MFLIQFLFFDNLHSINFSFSITLNLYSNLPIQCRLFWNPNIKKDNKKAIGNFTFVMPTRLIVYYLVLFLINFFILTTLTISSEINSLILLIIFHTIKHYLYYTIFIFIMSIVNLIFSSFTKNTRLREPLKRVFLYY